MNLLKVSAGVEPDSRLVALFKNNPNTESEVKVNIGDCGELTVVHGGNIVASAKKAGVKEMWVDVELRSEGWVDFKMLVGKAYDGTELDQELLHPDFAQWHVTRSTGKRLRELLQDLGDINGKTILVQNCGIGFFCHELVKRGATVIGLDPSLHKINAAKHLSKVYEMPKDNPTFKHGSLLTHGTEDKYYAIFWQGGYWTTLLSKIDNRLFPNQYIALDLLGNYTNRLYVELEPGVLSREMSDPSLPVRTSKWESWKVISIADWPLLRYLKRAEVSAWVRLLEILRLRKREDLDLVKAETCSKCGKPMRFNPCGGFWWCVCQQERSQ